MSLRLEIDLFDKNNWQVNNSSLIAETLGFKDDELFRDCLSAFITEIVLNATVLEYIMVLAHNYLVSNGCLLKQK
ncbi:MAG: hypothetical protein XD95_0147 [Microgenomates bacterium 39_7]|nr:MAG: hypothetical protein XD95_0147 [Microgenomates bacterium 39_7]